MKCELSNMGPRGGGFDSKDEDNKPKDNDLSLRVGVYVYLCIHVCMHVGMHVGM